MFNFLKKQKNDQNDVGFRDEFTEMDELALPTWAKTSLIVLTFLFVSLLLWACLAKIDKIVRAQGKLVTTGHEIVVRPLVDSIMKSIDVRIGQVVKQGDKILTLDPTFAQSDLSQLNIKIENAKAVIYRTQCELNGEKFLLPAEDRYGAYKLQHSIYTQRSSGFNAKIQSFDLQILSAQETARSASAQLQELKKQINYADEIRKMRQEVFGAGYDTKLNLLEAENSYSQLKSQEESLIKTISASEFESKRLSSEKSAYTNEWRRDLTTELAKSKSELDIAMEQLSKAERYSQLVEMTVPQDSVVLEIGKISVGSVAKTGEALVTLVPLNEPLEAEAHIAPMDVGFIRNGDPCKIKIDAFPFQKHGDLKGSLKSISEDTVNDPAKRDQPSYYIGRIALDTIKLRKVPDDTRLLPGMSLSAEIVVGQRTVISYLLYPMIQVFDESIREP